MNSSRTRSDAVPTVLLSAGSEIITLSLVEELSEAGAPIALASFGQRSLLAGSRHLVAYTEVPWPDSPARAAQALLAFTQPLAQRAGGKLVAFATDDAVLRLLLEYRTELEATLCVPRAKSLTLSGLDKAEFFEFLAHHGLAEHAPPFIVLSSPSDLERAVAALGPELVVKPALKPYRSELALDGSGRKLLATWEYPDLHAFGAALREQWDFSQRWLAQPRLHTPPEGEAVVWIVRAPSGEMRQIAAVARWKHPPVGGTGCVVETRRNPELEAEARHLAQAMSLEGLAEFEFLLDATGNFRVLECNPRPWLQVALARAGGLPVAAATWRALSGAAAPFATADGAKAGRSWVMIERLLLSAAGSARGQRLATLARAASAAWRADYVPVYQSPLHGVRRAWARRMLRALWRRVRRNG